MLKESLARREYIMTTIRAFITRRPLPTYFALAFAISCGGILLLVGPGGIPGSTEQTEMLLPFVVLAMLVGPGVAGILLTGFVYGKAGLRQLLHRLLRWRVDARWYAVALLTAPLLVTAVLLALSLTSPIFLPGIFTSDDKAALLLVGIAYGLAAGFFEELGWTGVAVPGLRPRYEVLGTGGAPLDLVPLVGHRHVGRRRGGRRGQRREALATAAPGRVA